MRHIITVMFAVALATCAIAEEYTLTGERWLRKYSADRATPVYNTQVDAARLVKKFCDVAWEKSEVESATLTYHDSSLLNTNVTLRENYDAALFCAYHANATHVAYANAACYRIDLGTGTMPRLTSLAVNVYSDPYNSNGARIVLMTNDSGTIPTDCATVRGDVTGGIKATNVAKRVTVTSGGKDTWYSATSNLVFGTAQLGASGLALKRYLMVFVLMENYSTTRGDWFEGSSFIDNEITITTSAALPGAGGEACDVAEPYATTYHLKDGRAGDDDDGDGLSNYAEYLITEVFKYANLNPDNAKSDGSTPDYFRKVGDVYMGEIFKDRDEANDFCPTVTISITYNGPQKIEAFVIKAWKDADMMTQPDAAWVVDESAGERTGTVWSYTLKTKGSNIQEGRHIFVVYATTSGSGSASPVTSAPGYTAGAPYGFVRDVNVGWNSAEIELEITDANPVFARLDLEDGSNDRTEIYGTDSGNVVTNADSQVQVLSGGKLNHVRIVPYSFTCWAFEHDPTDRSFAQLSNYNSTDLTHRVVAEFDVDTRTRPFITEADFIRDESFDIDWNKFETKAFSKHPAMTTGGITDITAVRYRIVLGSEGPVAINSSSDTSTVVRAFPTLIERRFESSDARTLPSSLELAGGSVLYGGRPTFKWRLDEPQEIDGDTKGSALFGCSYTAFQIQIADTANNVVWDSGVQRAPKKDAEGNFVWTAPVVAGQQTSLAKILSKAGDWKWRVAMYNSKFKPQNSPFASNVWSDYATFSTAVGQQQETDDHGYGSVKVSVKYAGPVAVLADCTSTSVTNGKVRVQAFLTPDFSGVPEAETLVTNRVALTNTCDITPNVTLSGLKNDATYYLRAYIDSDGDFKKSDWESWGETKTGVAISANKAAETVEIWIEDADTDGDWLPDAWEMQAYSSLTNRSICPRDGGYVVLDASTYNSIVSGSATISRNLSGASLTFFENLSGAADLLSILSPTTNTLDSIRTAVENNIEGD